MLPREYHKEFIEDEEPKDYFYHHRNQCANVCLVGALALESEFDLFAEKVLPAEVTTQTMNPPPVLSTVRGRRSYCLDEVCLVFLLAK